jgi:hypothetical protein
MMRLRITAIAAFAALVVASGAVASERITIQGQPVLGGCQYEATVTVLPGQPAVEQHEVSEDPATCTMVMEQGIPVGAGSEQTDSDMTTLNDAQTVTTPERAPGFADTAASTTHSAGYSRTWLEDPCPAPCLVVTVVQNAIDWYWDDPYITPGSEVICPPEYDWAWQTGWGLHENNAQCNLNQPEYPTTWADSTSYVHFKNGIFCGFTDTHVYYNRNHAYGYGDGRLVGRWQVTKSGTCSGLLSVHNRTARTRN